MSEPLLQTILGGLFAIIAALVQTLFGRFLNRQGDARPAAAPAPTTQGAPPAQASVWKKRSLALAGVLTAGYALGRSGEIRNLVRASAIRVARACGR